MLAEVVEKGENTDRAAIRKSIERQTTPERDRFSGIPLYATNFQRELAAREGKLVPLHNPHPLFGMVPDLRRHWQKRLLRPEAAVFTETLLWGIDEQYQLREKGLAYIVTSCHRTFSEQRILVLSNDGFLANDVGKSTHHYGASIDIAVQHFVRFPNDAFVGTWKHPASLFYDPKLFEKLEETLELLQSIGLCNVVKEYKFVDGTQIPACYHVCVYPSTPEDVQLWFSELGLIGTRRNR